MNRVAALFALFILAGASSPAVPMAKNGAQAQAASASWFDSSYRRESASKWLSELSRVNRQIPTLSPAEQLWLKTEIDDEMAAAGNRYTKRALAAMDSREYQLRVTKPRLDSIVRILGSLSSTRSQPIRTEVNLWAQLASRYMDKELWQAIDALVRSKVIDSRINGVDSLYYENHLPWAKQVINGVVLPYLSGELR
jgi:hypothetical protein